MAYTAQFGNGFSASISAEARRNTQIINIRVTSLSWWRRAATSAAAASRRLAAPSPASALRRLAGSGYRRQPARRPGLGFCPDHGRSAPGQRDLLCNHGVGHAHRLEPTVIRAMSGASQSVAGLQAERSVHRPRRLLRTARSSTPKVRSGICIQNPNGNMWLQDGQNATFGVLSDGVYGGTICRWHRHQRPADDGLGRQCGLRALLEPAVENVSLRRLCADELQRASQCAPLHGLWCRHGTGHARAGERRLRQQLEPVVDRLSYAVEHDQGLLHGSRRRLHEVRDAPRCRVG